VPADRYPTTSEVREVGPRDGLQNEAPIPIEARVELIDALSLTGLAAIEVGSFIRSDAIPAMAGTDRVLAAISRHPDVRYRALVPNVRGAEQALEGGIDELEVVVSVSETHNRHNLNMSVGDSVDQIAAIVDRAAADDTPVEAILATSFGCPYEVYVEPAAVTTLATRLRDVGVTSFSFADTTGMGTPRSVGALIDALAHIALPAEEIALHLHNTRGTGLANLVIAAQRGVRRYDASIGGLGGCPFSPGATGNVPTEDVVHLLDALGARTGVDLDALIAIALELETTIGRSLPGQVMRSGAWDRRVGVDPVPHTV